MGTAAGLFPPNGKGQPTISNRIGNMILFWLLIVVTNRFVNQGKSRENQLNLNIKVTMLTISSLFLIIIVRYLWVIC